MGNQVYAQGAYSTALGYQVYAQGAYSTALGYGAVAGSASIALGPGANAYEVNSIALGNSAFANKANSIVLNALGVSVSSPDVGSFVVKPVRGLASGASLAYDTNTGEISYLTSSRRYKTDVIGVSDAAAERVIDGLRPVSFRSLHDGEESGGSSPRYYGFIAEEVAEVDPLLVFTRRRSNNGSEVAGGGGSGAPQEAEEEIVEGVHYERVVPLLVQEVGRLKREHSQELEALRAANGELERADGEHARDLEALRTANGELERRLGALESLFA